MTFSNSSKRNIILFAAAFVLFSRHLYPPPEGQASAALLLFAYRGGLSAGAGLFDKRSPFLGKGLSRRRVGRQRAGKERLVVLSHATLSDTNVLSGTATPTLTTKQCRSIEDGDRCYCIITDAAGSKITSSKATLTVTTATSALAITSQPKDATVYVGEDAVFSVTVSGGKTPYTYQWHLQRPGEGPGIPYEGMFYSGTTTDALSVKGIADGDNGNQYWCVVTDADGTEITSAVMVLGRELIPFDHPNS